VGVWNPRNERATGRWIRTWVSGIPRCLESPDDPESGSSKMRLTEISPARRRLGRITTPIGVYLERKSCLVFESADPSNEAPRQVEPTDMLDSTIEFITLTSTCREIRKNSRRSLIRYAASRL
jgi:hypothetical protein